MEAIINLIARYQKIKEMMKQYIRLFNNTHSELYNITITANNYIKIINEKLDSKLPDDIKTAVDIFYIEDILSTVEIIITFINGLFINELALDKKNTTEMKEIYNSFNSIINSSIYISEHDELIHIFLETIKENDINHIESLYKKHNNTLKLYIHYLRYLSNNETIDINSKLEELKYNTITKIEIENKLYTHSLKFNIQRYNLFPIHRNLNENDIINIFFYIQSNVITGGTETKIATIDNVRNNLETLNTICLEKKYGVCLMIRISPKTVCYNFDVKSTHNKNNSTSGVSNESIDMCRFIKKGTSGYTNKLNANITFGYKNASNWIIIKTIDNSSYDIYGDNKRNIIHKKNTIDKIERGSSLLIDTYNKIGAFKFTSHIKRPNPIQVNVANVELINIIKYITLSLNTEIERKIDTGFTNLDELYKAISGKWIKLFIQSILIDDLKSHDETITCFVLCDVYNIASSILKFIDEDISRVNIDKDIFTKNTIHYIVTFIKKTISRIVTNAIEKTMTPNSNIYKKIYIRKSLLNIN